MRGASFQVSSRFHIERGIGTGSACSSVYVSKREMEKEMECTLYLSQAITSYHKHVTCSM